ncbi:MAG: leucyl/phenylalanyl-tRNA--protein transferase [Hyphomicrobiaceae bacterium]
MASRDNPLLEITPEVLLKAYSCGIFPMAESADDPQLFWIEPQARGLLPLSDIKIPRRLVRTIRRHPFNVRVDTDFWGVIDGCAASKPGRTSTWINERIRGLYSDLYEMGHCHTVETWSADDELVGGLYGVVLGGVFFGESMFSRRRDASKIALVYLCARLIRGQFAMLDTQFVTEHLRQFGAIEIDRVAFQSKLDAALQHQGDFFALPDDVTPDEVLATIRPGTPRGHVSKTAKG